MLAAAFAGHASCFAANWDETHPVGFTIQKLAVERNPISSWNWTQGYAVVVFNEPIGPEWWAVCYQQQLYIPLQTAGGRYAYQTLLIAKTTGQLIKRIKGTTADPGTSNTCRLDWIEL
jgi:hypothetical protein